MNNYIGLYIHIPFCKSKCPYCDFFSSVSNENDYDSYIFELSQKIKYWGTKTDKKVFSIYFGGGTPSLMGAERLCCLLKCIKENFEIIDDAEVTAEVNPDSGKSIDFEVMRQSGFNRISIGLQSAVQDELKLLGRIHKTEDARQTVLRAKKAGFDNISLDLMMGIPRQSIESLRESIEFCAECRVQHISSYILKIEKNTPFYKRQAGLEVADEDMQAEMYLYAVDILDKLGYKQYEISNFALPGYESRHNLNYWNCGEYIGIGPSAHSFFNGKRFYYERNMEDFIAGKTVFDCYGGDEEEFIMLNLRLKNGIIFDEYKRRFGKNLSSKTMNKVKQYEKLGYIIFDKNHFYLTPKGFLVSNAIISELI